MIICENCGANIDDTAVECPYCHAAQLQASERRYMNDLYSMNDTMDNMGDNAIKVELKTTLKHALIMIGIFAVCIIIGTIYGTLDYKSNHDSTKEQNRIIASYQWYDDNVDYLNRLYENRDFETIYEMYRSDSSSDFTRYIKNWEHYGIFNLYCYSYKYLLSYIDDDMYTKYDSSYVGAYRYCVRFVADRDEMAASSDSNMAFTEEDMEISSEWVRGIYTFVMQNLKVTQEEFENDIKNNDSYSYEDMKRIATEYYNRAYAQ